MWADLVLRAERRHAFEMLAWAALALIMGTASFLVARRNAGQSGLLGAFAAQLALWAMAIGSIGALELQGVSMRDLSSAARLERLMWARAGFDVGIIGMGLVLGGASRVLAQSLRGVGAATAIAAHGLALMIIDLRLLAAISR